jgi:hypothetical protein
MMKFILSFFIMIPVILAAMSVWRSPLSASRAVGHLFGQRGGSSDEAASRGEYPGRLSKRWSEKVEKHSDLRFAVVLLTAEDKCNLKGELPQPRAGRMCC